MIKVTNVAILCHAMWTTLASGIEAQKNLHEKEDIKLYLCYNDNGLFIYLYSLYTFY